MALLSHSPRGCCPVTSVEAASASPGHCSALPALTHRPPSTSANILRHESRPFTCFTHSYSLRSYPSPLLSSRFAQLPVPFCSHPTNLRQPYTHQSMYPLLVAVVLLTLLLQPTEAASPVMDQTALFATPFNFESPPYPDPDGMLEAMCDICKLSYDVCMCAFSHPTRRPTFTIETFYDHPEWPHDDSFTVALPDISPEPLPYQTFETDRQPLIDQTLQQLEDTATKVRADTVQSHVLDTYTPGDRIIAQAAASRRLAQRRLPPSIGGFLCEHSRCGKRFNRACDLNRHAKTHKTSSDRPHKCSYCNQGFLYPKDRARHEKTHDGSPASSTTVYCRIDGCNNDGFSRRDNLLRHHRKQHPGIPIPA
ncbi:hypothetical protein BDV96DRAFT_121466 [Lophiotrema nucula]|uniref:C2H2-type domain-containing protein n=1 Tax=Lophiotrema nucula TaxID=690887 RepID=A0A6A5Z1L5_9PLEO|nr:hypothetical protein BDV96DRAFT_121466 [Lophiotrema nucula]